MGFGFGHLASTFEYSIISYPFTFIIGIFIGYLCDRKSKDMCVKYKKRLICCIVLICAIIVLVFLCMFFDAYRSHCNNNGWNALGMGNGGGGGDNEVVEVELKPTFDEILSEYSQKAFNIVNPMRVICIGLTSGIFIGFVLCWLFKDRNIIKNLDSEIQNSISAKFTFICIFTIIHIIVTLCVMYSTATKLVDIGKPVIYLYGYDEDVNVKVDFNDTTEFTVTYPEYDNGWSVKAYSDGKLVGSNNREYKYLYYEAKTDCDNFNITSGFCVESKDVSEFLYDSLKKQGLNDYEIEDFITYWLPQMQKFNYSVICFDNVEYDKIADLNIDKKPDEMIRVYMVWYGSDKYVDIAPQVLDIRNIDRLNKKVVVEWGGTQLD